MYAISTLHLVHIQHGHAFPKKFAKISLPKISSNTGVRTRATILGKLALDYTCLILALSAVLSTDVKNPAYTQPFLSIWLYPVVAFWING